MRKRDEVVLWSVYFDSTRTRAEGRKIPRRLAKPAPTLDMVGKAVGNLGHSYEVVSEAATLVFIGKRLVSYLLRKRSLKTSLSWKLLRKFRDLWSEFQIRNVYITRLVSFRYLFLWS